MATGPFSELFQSVKIRNYNIKYIKVGSGPIQIFCFPGIMASFRHYGEHFIRRFGEDGNSTTFSFYVWDNPGMTCMAPTMFSGYFIIYSDPKGYFQSSPPVRSFDDISLELDAEIGVELLKSLSPISPWILMGWCGGAQTALKIALEYPQMVEKLVIWATWELIEDVPRFERHRDLSLVNETILANRLLFHRFCYEDYELHHHAWMKMLERVYMNKDRREYAQQFEGLQCPILMLAGTNDYFFPVFHMRYLHEHIKHSRLEIIEGAPHNMHSTHYEEMYAIINPFLQE